MSRESQVPRPIAVGTDFVHGNELTLFERRMAPLQFIEPYFLQKGLSDMRVDKEPLRFSEHMKQIRSDEMTGYGKRRMKDIRKMKNEFSDKIKAIMDRQKKEEEEARRNKRDKRARWWHRSREADQKDPMKCLRYTNLTLVPESLLMSKDVVTLQLTGARLGDTAMNWIGGFLQQSHTIKRLILQGNYITEEGVNHIVLGLRGSKSLMELNMSFNPIGDVGIELLSNAILENNKFGKLYLLNVSCCELSSASGLHLGRLIRESKHMRCLLAWRNRLGVAEGAPLSGAGYILDELRHSPHMRVVNLTANNITDKEASDHASALERNTRRMTVANLEKASRQKRIEQFNAEIAERKRRMAGARNNEERIIVHRLERQVEQEVKKMEMTVKIEERQKTYAQKIELEFRLRVERLTGEQLVEQNIPCRLILTANSIEPPTSRRLSKYYDLSSTPDTEAFVNHQRRYDRLVVPRRQVGEEYGGQRDPDAFDAHSVLPWDKAYDPQSEFERRQALIQWKEDERIRDEELVVADFNKFKMTDPSLLTPEERAKAGPGFGVASGVNARVKLVRDPAKAAAEKEQKDREEQERLARIREQYGLKVDAAATAASARTPQYVSKRLKDESMIGLGNTSAAPAMPQEEIALIIDPSMSAAAADAAGVEASSYLSSMAAAALEIHVDEATGETYHEVEVNESELMKAKMEERMQELRHHVEQKSSTLHRQESNLAGVTKAASLSLPLANAAAPESSGDDPISRVLAAMDVVRKTWEIIRELGEIGSPSDEDLKRVEQTKHTLHQQKNRVTELLRGLDREEVAKTPITSDSEIGQYLEQFLEDIVKETDAIPGNVDLVSAMMETLPLELPRILSERGLVAMAASDGSEGYLTRFLSLPHHQFDVSEVCAACFYNQSARIPLTLMVLQFMDLQPYAEEIGDMLREFFGDVASDRRAIPKENRVLKNVLLRNMVSMEWLGLDYCTESSDGQSIFTRALYEGDTDVVDLILEQPSRIVDINAPLSDGTTPLIQAVLGNSYQLVSRLFTVFPSIDVSIRSENGNALDLAIGLSRESRIISLLREHGAQPSGAKVDKNAAAPKKIKMKVKVGVGAGGTSGTAGARVSPQPKPSSKPPSAQGGKSKH